MSIVSILIPVSLVLLGLGVWAFFWAVRAGQFEELDAASWEILIEERRPQELAAPAAPPCVPALRPADETASAPRPLDETFPARGA